MSEQTKVCGGPCGERKPLSDFHKDKRRSDGHVKMCKPCRKEYRAAWYAQNRQGQIDYSRSWKRRNRHRLAHYGRKYRHGITQAEWDAMVLAQEGRCAICEATNGDLRIDHDHTTGVIRGLLCDLCNRGIGYLRDNPDHLRRAATYLGGGA